MFIKVCLDGIIRLYPGVLVQAGLKTLIHIFLLNGVNMKSLEKIKETLSEHKHEIMDKFNVKTIGVFGSYVRGEQKKKSDLDLLVEFKEPIGLFKFIDLENYLSDLLEVKVDLVTKKSLKPRIGAHILQEAVYV